MSSFQEGSLGDRLRRWWQDRKPGPGLTPVHVADPRFDGWEVVGDYGRVEGARAWHQHLEDAGFDCALTSDWPLDRFGRGDISLRVPREQWSDAVAFLDNLDAEMEADDGDEDEEVIDAEVDEGFGGDPR